jgi:hypothetical protein
LASRASARAAPVPRTMTRYRPHCVGQAVAGVVFPGSSDFSRLQGGFLPLGGEGRGAINRRQYYTAHICFFGDAMAGSPSCFAASAPQPFRASSAGSAVGLMEASSFRSLEPVNGARFARRLRRSETIDRLETSEVHASMRSTARCVAERGRGGCRREILERSARIGSRNAAMRILSASSILITGP